MINYNDYSLPNSMQFSAISQSFNSIKVQEISELKDILHKLREQKNGFELLDKNKYTNIINQINNSISNIERLVLSTQKPQNTSENIVVTPYKNATKEKKKSNFSNNLFANIFKKFNFQFKEPQMKYHTIVVGNDELITTTYHSHRQLCSRQIDIIRLLLLYMSLRPTCPYIHSISKVATEQLDVYISLISEN